MRTQRIVISVAVFVGIALAFGSYLALNYPPESFRWPANWAWDPATQALVTPDTGADATQAFVFKSWLDEYVPFVPLLAIPYLSYLLLVPIVTPLLNLAVGYFKPFLTVGISLIVGQLFLDLAFWLFQSTVPRTAEVPEGFQGMLVELVWGNDQPFNGYPSGHITWTTIAIISLWRLRHRLPKTAWIMMLWLLLIYPATLMLQQHYLMDVYAGLFVGFTTYWAVMFVVERPTLAIDKLGGSK